MRQKSYRRFAIALLALGSLAVVAQGCSERRYERTTGVDSPQRFVQQQSQPALAAPEPAPVQRAAAPQARVLEVPPAAVAEPEQPTIVLRQPPRGPPGHPAP